MPKRLTPAGQAAPPVEPIVTGATLPPKPAESTKRAKRPKTDQPGIKYVRNLHNVKATVRLASGRAINLEPRGQRDDADIVNADEQQDPKFLANKNLIFEVIEVEAAREIIAKQQHNSRQQPHELWQHMRNPQGHAYEEASVGGLGASPQEQEILVGRVSSPAEDGSSSSQSIIMQRTGPQVVQVPGSPEHPATKLAESIPSSIDPADYHEFLLWRQFKEEQARRGE